MLKFFKVKKRHHIDALVYLDLNCFIGPASANLKQSINELEVLMQKPFHILPLSILNSN